MIKTNFSLPRILLAFMGAVLSVAATFGQVSVTIGTLQPTESVTITYEATIDANLSPTVTQISSQGTITGSFTTFTTDDPETTALNDATLTPVSNNPPVVDLNGGGAGNDVAVTFSEPTAQLIAPAGTITDAEGNPILSLTATLTSEPNGKRGRITFSGCFSHLGGCGTFSELYLGHGRFAHQRLSLGCDVPNDSARDSLQQHQQRPHHYLALRDGGGQRHQSGDDPNLDRGHQ